MMALKMKAFLTSSEAGDRLRTNRLKLEQFGVLAEYAQFPNLAELFGAIK